MDLNVAVSMLFAISIFLIFYGIDVTLSSQFSSIEARLDRYAGRTAASPLRQPAFPARKKESRLNKMLSASAGSQIATDLARADLRLTPGEYLMLNFLSVVVGYLLGLVFFHGSYILAIAGAITGFYAPRFYVRRLQAQRLKAFNNQLGDTIVLLSNSLRSGYSLLQSMETVSRELTPPMSTEFARVSREVGLGLTVQDALANLLRRIPSDDLDLMITAINVQHEVGGNLAEILDTIAHTIRERVRILGEIRSITAQQRLTGTVLSILPIGLGLVMYAINPGYISGLWQSTCGWIMMGVGGALIVIGYFVIRKIADIEV